MPSLTRKRPAAAPSSNEQPVERIIDDLLPLTVDIDVPVYDPENARLHPEENDAAIQASLTRYGQRKPIVVNRRTGHVEAGNGTLAAARALGWRRIAAVWVDDDRVTAIGYGLADNRTAELARWDYEVVERLNKLQQEAGETPVGWNLAQLMALRTAEEGQTWQELWQGMPEFVQDDLTADNHITVNFRSKDDRLAFLKLIGQEPKDTVNNSIWHPRAELDRNAHLAYASQEDGR